jgi:hypothetical protein
MFNDDFYLGLSLFLHGSRRRSRRGTTEAAADQAQRCGTQDDLHQGPSEKRREMTQWGLGPRPPYGSSKMAGNSNKTYIGEMGPWAYHIPFLRKTVW